MNVSFRGLNEKVNTFEAVTTGANAVVAGKPVAISSNGTVSACAANSVPVGIALDVRDGLVSVQVGGYMTAECEASLTVGFVKIGTTAAGKITSYASGREVFIVDKNTADGTCGFIV